MSAVQLPSDGLSKTGWLLHVLSSDAAASEGKIRQLLFGQSDPAVGKGFRDVLQFAVYLGAEGGGRVHSFPFFQWCSDLTAL